MKSVEHSGDIMQGITLLISVPDNRFLFRRVVNARSSFHGNVPLQLRIALHRPVELTARIGHMPPMEAEKAQYAALAAQIVAA